MLENSESPDQVQRPKLTLIDGGLSNTPPDQEKSAGAEQISVQDKQEEHLHQAPKEAKQVKQNPGGTIGDIIKEVERAEQGAIIFTRGITAKHDQSDAHATTEKRREAAGYIGGVKEFYAEDDNVVVISGEELLHEGAGAHGGSMDSAIKTLEKKHGNKTLVIDAQPKLDELFFKPWEKLGSSMNSVMKTRGAAGEVWLKDWIARQQSGQAPKEGEPKIEDVIEAFKGSWDALQNFRSTHLGKRRFSMGLDADNPLELAFLVFCETGRLDAQAIETTLGPAARVKDRIGFIHVLSDNTLQTSLGQDQAHTRRMAA